MLIHLLLVTCKCRNKKKLANGAVTILCRTESQHHLLVTCTMNGKSRPMASRLCAHCFSFANDNEGKNVDHAVFLCLYVWINFKCLFFRHFFFYFLGAVWKGNVYLWIGLHLHERVGHVHVNVTLSDYQPLMPEAFEFLWNEVFIILRVFWQCFSFFWGGPSFHLLKFTWLCCDFSFPGHYNQNGSFQGIKSQNSGSRHDLPPAFVQVHHPFTPRPLFLKINK